MYEILEVMPTASLADIKAAHKRLSLKIMSGATSQNRQECEFQLKVLDVALNTLLSSRDAYDAELAVASPVTEVVPYKASALAPAGEANVLALVAELESNRTALSARLESHPSALQVASSTVKTSAKSLKVILRAVIGLLILGSVVTVGRLSSASSQPAIPAAERAKAEDKLVILEYYKKHGVRPASRAEADFLEAEDRRKENEQRAGEFAEQRRDEEYRRFVSESRREGERVHQDLANAEMEERWRQLREAEEKRSQEEAAKEEERNRIENERRRYGIYSPAE